MIHKISLDLTIHASTQMTIPSPEAFEFTKPFDIERVVLGREDSLKQIRTIGEQARLPIEVFVHGALCVSYSGQCLTSEMWGGRSANRWECAQACCLPYDLMVDGEVKPMGYITCLLCPKALAAIVLMSELIEAGVTSFKIEGQLKRPEYVANVVRRLHVGEEWKTLKAPISWGLWVQPETGKLVGCPACESLLQPKNYKTLDNPSQNTNHHRGN
jgi:putative protease